MYALCGLLALALRKLFGRKPKTQQRSQREDLNDLE